jgi:MFS family permease
MTKPHSTRTLWLCGILHAFTHIYHVALLPLYLLIQKDFQITNYGQVTFLMTLIGLSCCLASYPIGILADHFSRKRLLAIGLVINGLGFIGLGYAPTYSWAVFWCIISGLGGSFYHPAATAMLADLFPEGTGKALGRVGMGAAFGFFIGPAYTGWRGEMSGWRAPIIELGILGIVAAACFAWLAPKVPVHPAEEKGASSRGLLYPNIQFWIAVFFYSLFFGFRDFAGAGMATLVSLFLQRVGQWSPEKTGSVLGSMLLVALISNPLFGSLSDRSRSRWTCFVLLVSAIMILLIPRVSFTWVVPCLTVYGFFFLSSYPITEAALMETVTQKVRGRVFGVFISVGGVIASLSHWIMGSWVNSLPEHASTTYIPLFNTLAVLVVMGLGGLLLLRLIRKFSKATS